MTTLRFHLDADVSSARWGAIGPFFEQLVDGTVTRRPNVSIWKVRMEGVHARTLHRELLSAMRRIEPRARLYAEWTAEDRTYQFFEHIAEAP